jgi:hypothetical protein
LLAKETVTASTRRHQVCTRAALSRS